MSDTSAATTASPDDLFAPTASGISPANSYAWSAKGRSLGGLHGWLRMLLFLYLAGHAFSLLVVIGMLWVFWVLATGAVDPITAAIANMVSGGGQFLPFAVAGAFIACVVCYLMFVYRAMKNLHLAKARGLAISPGWAVGWSFVPFANIGMIFSVMKQIWVASADPEKNRREAPSTLNWWWGLYLTGNIISSISNAVSPTDPDANAPTALFAAYLPGTLLAMVSSLCLVASTFCLLRIIQQITASQEILRSTAAFDE